MEGGEMPATEVLPFHRLEDHPDVRDVRARLCALEGEGIDLQRRVIECERTVTVLQAQCEATKNAVFLGHQPASDLERVQTALREARAAHQAVQADAAAHEAKQARLTSLAQAVEGDAAATVKRRQLEAYAEAVRAVDQQLRETVEALQRMRALQEHARREFPDRTVLPYVEPIVRPQPYQPVGVEDLFWNWEHDPDVQRLLGYRT
jgi:hypothetical protein